jgi:endonuclease/exonuclease/phosphatase (EEP) superfamily protein YafD
VTLRGFLTAAGALFSLATLAGFGELLWWVLDLFAHFRVQYFLVLSAVALMLLVLKRPRTAALFALFAMVNLVFIAPLYFGRPDVSGDPASLRAMLLNVNRGMGDPDRVKEVISDYDPDFLVLEEVNYQWLIDLKDLTAEYPHFVSRSREDNFGIALFSKRSIVDSEIVYISNSQVPSVIGRFDIDGRPLTVVGTHPLRPGNRTYNHLRDEQLEATPALLKKIETPVLLLGDLNTTPWSFRFKRLIRESGLQDSARGFGIQSTWPTILFPLRIPIDHCLHSPGISILDRQVGPHVGSDHFPLIVDFALSSMQDGK